MAGIEFIDGALEANRPLLYKVEQLQTLVLILFRHADNQSQVGRHHSIAGTLSHPDLVLLPRGEILLRQHFELLHLLDMMGELDFFGGREQWNPSNAAQIKANRIGRQASALA